MSKAAASGLGRRVEASARESWDILGVDVQVWNQHQAVRALDAKFNETEPTCVAFANTNLLNIAASNPRLRSVLKTFTVVNDGVGMNIAARVLHGRVFPSNLNGTDFIPFYLSNTVHNHRVFLRALRRHPVRGAMLVAACILIGVVMLAWLPAPLSRAHALALAPFAVAIYFAVRLLRRSDDGDTARRR